MATLKAKVDQAIAAKTWVVFTFHGITPTPSTNPDDYQYGTAELDELAAYVKTKVTAGQIKNVNVSKGLVTGTPNKMPNASFNCGHRRGLADRRPRDHHGGHRHNGSYPDPTRSVKLVSGATPSHLFSPQVAVTPGTNYLYKTFLNVSALTLGRGRVLRRRVQRGRSLDLRAVPEAGELPVGGGAQLHLHAELHERSQGESPGDRPGTGITAYLDNVELLALGAETPPPPPANLVTNGTFDAGLGGGWRTDAATAIVADSAGNGAPANPVNSVKLQGTTANGHLFSPQVNVTPGNYNISAYLNIQSRTAGEVGWYIDEYDANGQLDLRAVEARQHRARRRQRRPDLLAEHDQRREG